MFPRRLGWPLVALSGLLLAAGVVIWNASRAVEESAASIAREGEIAFSAGPVRHVIPPGATPLSVPAIYSDAVLYGDRIYLGGAAGLFAYDGEGRLLASHRAGFELPPAPIVDLAVGLGPEGRELWAATSSEGLLAFNGTRFRHIRPEKPEYRALTAVLPLNTGRVLLGTQRAGVLAFDGARIAAFHPSLKDLRVSTLDGTESDLWIGTVNRGALHWSGGRMNDLNQLPDTHVLSVAHHGTRVFAGTALGIAEFRDGRLYRKLADGVFAKALLARPDKLLAGTLDEGVYEIPMTGDRPRPEQSGGIALDVPVERFIEAGDKTYILGRDGLYSREGRLLFGRTESTLTDRNVAALSVDSQGRLWVGYFDRGLDVVDGDRVTHIEDEHLFCVNRVAHRKDAHLVATANGLVLLDAALKKKQVLTRADGLIANHVTDILVGEERTAVATPAGITFLDGGGARSLYAFHGLVNNHVYALGGGAGLYLIGTLGGASLLESGVVKANYTTANSPLGHNWISAIATVDDEWFVGTYGAGVHRLDRTRTWHKFSDMPKDIVINPNAMTSTSSHVFAGSLNSGLLVFDRSTARWRTVRDGLPSLNVTAVAAAAGMVFVGTDNGVVRRREDAL